MSLQHPRLAQIWRNARRLVILFAPYRSGLAISIIAAAAGQAVGILIPHYSQQLIDSAYTPRSIGLVKLLVLVTIALIVSSALARLIQTASNSAIGLHSHADITCKLYNHLQRLAIPYFNEHRPGEIANTLQSVRSSVGVLLSAFQVVITNGIYLIVVPPLLISTVPILAAIALAPLPLMGYLAYRHARLSYSLSGRYLDGLARINALQTEAFSGIRSVKALGLEDFCMQSVAEATTASKAIQWKKIRSSTFYNGLSSFCKTISLAASTWVGWQLLLDDRISLGEFLAFTAYCGYLYAPLLDVIGTLSNVQESTALCMHICELFEMPREEVLWSSNHSNTTLPTSGDIELIDLSFGYANGVDIFRDVNVTLPARSINAVIGRSGSGKTTFVELLLGFHKPVRGCIRLGGVDVASVRLTQLRSIISAVWQHESLFPGTLWENFTTGVRAPSKRSVERLAEVCQLEHMLRSFPLGYQTLIGEGGTTLSAGERQRVALLRALLQNKPILLLDEVTSALDVDTEAALLSALWLECRDKLLIFVTHRLRSAASAHRIFRCGDGELKPAPSTIYATPFLRPIALRTALW